MFRRRPRRLAWFGTFACAASCASCFLVSPIGDIVHDGKDASLSDAPPDALSDARVPPLVAHWKFDDGTESKASDSSGHGQDGILEGHAQWTNAGRIGGGLLLDGVDSFVQLATPPIGDLDAFTYSGWFKTTLSTKEGLYNEFQANAQTYLNLNEDAVGDIAFGFAVPTDGGVYMGSAGAFNDGQWHHVALVQRTRSDRELFVDGTSIAVNRMTLAGTIGATRAVIGARLAPSTAKAYFAGALDDVRIYAGALTGAQVGSLATGGEP
jgi:sialidase-1